MSPPWDAGGTMGRYHAAALRGAGRELQDYSFVLNPLPERLRGCGRRRRQAAELGLGTSFFPM